MILRCRNPRRADFRWYGARGIQVCPRWLTEEVGGYPGGGFEMFLLDLGPRPEGMTLDRIDVDGHYEPSNCRWATPLMQASNRHEGGYPEEEPEPPLPPKWPDLVIRLPEPEEADGEPWPF